MSEIILYKTEDGKDTIHLQLDGHTVWLSQLEIAALFAITKQNVHLHLRNIFRDGELVEDSVVKESLTTASDGKIYCTKFYNLDAVLAVGYRVRSPRGSQFRRFARTVLHDYLVKGFAMNDERLKDPSGFDYFDELLERIRDIRASEKRFYQKARDLFAKTSQDYNSKSKTAHLFFQTIQN
ncbi:MAG: RhuM family protein, partial [Pseudomonadota bacterium]